MKIENSTKMKITRFHHHQSVSEVEGYFRKMDCIEFKNSLLDHKISRSSHDFGDFL